MRTTVDVPDPLFKELKLLAIERKTSLKQIIRAALEKEARGRAHGSGKLLKFPLLSSDAPASLSLTNAQIDDLLA